MRRIWLLASTVTLGLTSACAPQPAPAVDVEAERTALREADGLYSQAASAKDVEAIVALYTSDAVAYPPEAPIANGAEAIRGLLNAFVSDSAFAVRFTPVSVEVSSDADMGYTLNEGEVTFTGPDGKPMTERVRDFHVWRKQADGSWKIVVDLWNNEPPPVTPPATTTR